jgi:hypothetical protein
MTENDPRPDSDATTESPGDTSGRYPPIDWPSTPPADCPFAPSTDLVGVTFTGRHREYTNADCWFLSWASDGNMYSPFSDGVVENTLPDGTRERIRTIGFTDTAHGKVVGDDPMDLTVIGLGTVPAPPAPFLSIYPSGSLVHNGVWYYGFHPEGGGENGLVHLDGEPYEWPWIRPFVGFRISHDYGKTWIDAPHTPAKPLFDEPALDADGTPIPVPIQIGEPFFVDFGKNMEHSPDGKAYLVAHGATELGANPRDLKSSWCIGDHAYLLRVAPSPETMNDASQYEFFAGHDDHDKPVWTNQRSEMQPLIVWDGRVGCTSITYNPYLKKYLFCVTDGRGANSPYDTFILESPNITGPWKLVTFMEDFGQQGYFVNIPSRFISQDGRTAWLCYAANFSVNENPSLKSSPPGSRYAMNLQEIRLRER